MTDDSLLEPTPADPIAPPPQAVTPPDEELAALQDRHLRLAADFDNFRKRALKERSETWEKAQADLVLRLKGEGFVEEEWIHE